MHLVMARDPPSLWGASIYHAADPGIEALAGQASYGGPLDPVTPGSGERWMGVLRELLTINLDLAATAGRLWFEALTIRQSLRPEDRAWATHVVAVTEILRGHVWGAQRWMEAADAEADPQQHRPWIAETCKKLGVGKDRLVDPL